MTSTTNFPKHRPVDVEVSRCYTLESRQIQSLALSLHNNYRKAHEAPPLSLDLKLCEAAQIYANDIANGRRPTKIPGNDDLGRNIYRIENSGPRCEVYSETDALMEAVEMWYSYNSQYNWTVPISSSFLAKMFSQMVWKSTQKLGVGVATGGAEVKNTTAVVALYDPAGNSNTNYNYNKNVSPLPNQRKDLLRFLN